MKRLINKAVVLLLIMITALSFAACINGTDGLDGADGQNGDKGLSAYEIYMKYYDDYKGTEQEWINDLINGNLARFTVTFISNGGTSVDSLFNVRKRFGIKEPDPPFKEGFEFGGWYQDSELNTKWNFEINAVMQDMILFAMWLTPTEGLKFELINDGAEYAATGIGDAIGSEIVIPHKHNGLPVTAIGVDAFRSCVNLTSVIIPNSVTIIGNGAFYNCHNLDSVTIRNSVTIIGNEAFRNCTKLYSIIIPSSVTNIGSEAFFNCNNLRAIIIPSSVATMGNWVFCECFQLDFIRVEGFTEKPAGWSESWRYGCDAGVEWNYRAE